jgi:nicotinate-nucleotide adenylyltransferase
MRIGVFGGAFDPPHVGHLILAAECSYQLALNRLMWVLTPNPPHKQDLVVTPLGQRTAMLQAAIQDNTSFELSRVDLDRPGPHYAVDTLRLLGEAYPDADLVYLIGGDSLHDLPGWYRPGELLERVEFLGVMRRPGDGVDLSALERRLPGVAVKVKFVTAPLLEISSSQIRQRAASGRPFQYYLPPPVYQFILSGGLYCQ